MEYTFWCSKCGKRVIKAIPINDYDLEKNRQFHLEDGGKLERLIEFDGAIGVTGGYDAVSGKKAGWQS